MGLILFLVPMLPATTATAAPADQATQDVEAALNALVPFVDGLAGVGTLAQTLPGMDLRPGSADGLDLTTALSDTFTAPTGPLGGDYGGATTLDALATALSAVTNKTLPGGRTVTISASHTSTSGVDSLPVAITIERPTTPTGLAISTSGFTFDSAGGLNTDLKMQLGFTLNYSDSDRSAWLSAGAGTPSLGVSATTTLPTPGNVDASIGILKVTLAGTSTFNAAAAFSASFNDPNNDGRLTLLGPGAGSTGTELTAPGASAGLTNVTWDPSATASLAAGLTLTADITGLTGADNLASASATVSLGLDTSTHTVTSQVTAGSLGPFDAFENLSSKDLADTLAQLAQFLTSVQMTTLPGGLNVPLPFMKGTLADAVALNEALRKFIADHVEQIPVDPSTGSATVGKPDFASIQDLIKKLNAYAGFPGVGFNIPTVSFDPSTSKLSLDLHFSRSAGTPQPLDQPPSPTTSDGTGVTYTDTGINDPNHTYDVSYIGRAVTAGTFTGLIKDINGHTIDLDPAPLTPQGGPAPTDYWKGATTAQSRPPDGTAYSIAAADPQTGQAQLGDALKATTGLVKANASAPLANVAPSYSVDLPLVLDLSAPTSTTPTTVTNPDGTKTVVQSLPTPAQRVKLHTGGPNPLFSLDAPITTAVHAAASVGFLGVSLDGSLVECTTGTYVANHSPPSCGTIGSTHLLQVSLKTPTTAPSADSAGDISLPDFFKHLGGSGGGSPGDVLSASLNGEAHATLSVTVPDAKSFFSSPLTLSVDMADITSPAGVTVTAPNLSDLLGGLKAFDLSSTDPKALFNAVLTALSQLDSLSSQLGGTSGPLHDALATPLPLLGTSVKNLIGGSISGGDGVVYTANTLSDPNQNFTADDSKALAGRTVSAGTTVGTIASASGQVLTLAAPWSTQPADGTNYTVDDALAGVIDTLKADSADTLQDVVELLNQKLGSGSGVSFTLDSTTTPPNLHLNVDWKKSFSTQQPVSLDLGSFNLGGVQAHGTVKLAVDGELKAGLVIPLSSATIADPLSTLEMDPASSGVSVKATASLGDKDFIMANAGPLAISLGDPTAASSHLQASAALGVGMGDSTDTAPVPLSTFASNLGVNVNSGVNPVTCSEAPNVASDKYAICAALPIYTSADGKTWNLISGTTPDSSNSILLRVPQSTGTAVSDLTGQFDITGNLGDNTTPKLQVPSDLASKIANSFLDLSSLDQGLLGYLKFAQQSLQLASAGGKLPLIGSDLQQGADFLGNVQKQIDDVLGATNMPNGKLPTAGDVQNKLTDLAGKLNTAGLLPNGTSSLVPTLTCSGTLQQVTGVSATSANPQKGTVNYQYEVVATRNDGTGDTVPSTASASVQNLAPANLVANTSYNTVNWTPVPFATGYKILRSDDNNGDSLSQFYLVGTATGQSTSSYADFNTTGSDYNNPVGTPPTVTNVPCDASTSASDISGIEVSVDLGQGDPSNPSTSPLTAKVPLDIGVPGLSFHAVNDGTGSNDLTASIAWGLHLKFGLSRSRGFYVDTQDHDPSSPAGKSGPEFKVGVSVDLPAHIAAQLAFINLDVAKNTSTNDPNFKDKPLFLGTFSIDLKNGPKAADCSTPCNVDNTQYLDLATLQSITNVGDYVVPRLSAAAAIDWNLRADPNLPTVSSTALPGIGAEFKLHWGWSSADPNGSVLPDVLEFDNVTIDPGSFLGQVLQPIFAQVAKAMKPLQPVIDTIQAPIPVLSDLSKAVGGSDVTLATLAQEFSTLAGGPDIQPFIDVLTNINTVVKSLTSGACQGGVTFCVNVGSFDLNPQKATTETNTPDLATQDGFITNLQTPQTSPLDALASDSNYSGFTKTSGGSCSNPEDTTTCPHPGFTFPALQHPSQIFQLLLGHDVTLAQFDSGPLTLGFSMSEEFGPIYAPPPVDVVISGSAGVTLHVVAGFDTYGIRKAIESGKVTAGVLDSLYFSTTDANGKPLPVVTLTGSLAAGAEVTAFVLKAGVVGGISLTVNFYWNDPDNDGKFRFNEFLATALNNPVCLFNMGGSLNVFLEVFITIGFSPFDVSFNFTLVNVKLLDFSVQPNCAPPPPRLGGVSGKTLYLYAGKLGTDATRGAPWGENTKDENWVVRENSDKTVTVTALGVTHTFTQPIDTVVFDGRGYSTGNLSVTFQGAAKDVAFDLKQVVFGGNGDDTIRTGSGPSFVDGGPGNDTITTGDRPDPGAVTASAAPAAVVAGGPGNDVITTGNANDWVAGDSSLSASNVGSGTSASGYDTTSSDQSNNAPSGSVDLAGPGAVDPSTVGHPATPAENSYTGSPACDASHDGNDLITTGIGNSTIWGGGGNDKIATATASTVQQANPGNANYTPGSNTVVGGSGSDQIASGPGDDNIYTGSTATKIKPDDEGPVDLNCDGTAAVNAVDTGTGSDTVYGSQAEDDVTVHSLAAQGPTPAQSATVYGGGGNDVIDGGDGTDNLYGGPGNDYLIAQPATVDKATTHTDQLGAGAYTITYLPDPSPAAAKTLVGGGGSDRIYGGDGSSSIWGDHETVYASGDNTGPAQKDVCTSPGPAASDPPPEYPNAGYTPGAGTGAGAIDPAQADAADLIMGGSGSNVIAAGGGNDFVHSGSGNDTICGAGGNDLLDAGGGNDTVWGGSGDDVVYGGPGNDKLYGNDGNDTIYGTEGDNTLVGNDGTDTLFGGPGADLLIGGSDHAGRFDEGDVIAGGGGNDILIGDNGSQVDGSGNPDSSVAGPNPADVDASGQPMVTVYDLASTTPAKLGGKDTLHGGDGSDWIFGGLSDDALDGGSGADHLEGGPGSDTLYGGRGADDLIGGTSPVAVNGGSVDGIPDGSTASGDLTPTDLPTTGTVTGNTIYGDNADTPTDVPDPQNYADVIVGGNGSITGTGLTDPNDGAPVRDVRQLALLTVGGNDQISAGPGDNQVFGGFGDDTISTGSGDNHLEGGPGDDNISGGSGSNDIIGGTSPLALPTSGPDALTTASVPDGTDTVHADGLTAAPPAGYAQDGGNVVLGDNGCIDRQIGNTTVPRDAHGCPTGPATAPAVWSYNSTDPQAVTTEHPNGVVTRTIVQLDVTDCPNTSCAPDVQGAPDSIWGGTGDDLLFGETGNDQVYGGPPGTNGLNGTSGTYAGNDYMEGGAGSDTMAGGAGDDDMIGGTSPTYLPNGVTTAMVSDGTAGAGGFSLPAPANPLLTVPGSGSVGNTMDGGGGNDVMAGGNGRINHVLSSGVWSTNQNDNAYIRTIVQLDLTDGGPTAIGGDDTMRGGPGDDRMFGGTGNDYMEGGDGSDYLEGGAGRDALQGGNGEDDLVGGTSPVAVPVPLKLPSGYSSATAYTDAQAANMPDGAGVAGPNDAGNIICGYLCGQSTSVADNDVIVGNNGRIDRCAAVAGVPRGSDSCSWTTTGYGNEKATSSPAAAQSGQITTTSLGSTTTRYTTLLGQSPPNQPTAHDGNDYIEGNSGNDVIYGEDGSDAVHGDTPLAASPRLDECLATQDPTAGQDIILGGYGNDTLCGDGGDDGIVGSRGTVTIVPFSNAGGGTQTLGTVNGPTYGTLTTPGSGNTIYQVDLSREYSDGANVAVPDWNSPSATGQGGQHDVIFGGQGNDSLHGSPGDDFIQGDDGMLASGQTATGGDDIVFGDGGNDSMQGGPGNDHTFGGNGADDQDVVRSDSAIAPKVDDAGNCLSVAFPTINADPSGISGYCGTGWAAQSYVSRFPLPGGAPYSTTDPGALDNGGTTAHTKQFGDISFGGLDRDVSQSQATPAGYGDRIIDSYGAYNLEFVCPSAYGGFQIIRALSPSMLSFVQQLALADGAVGVNQTKSPPSTLSSGDSEASIVYPGQAQPDNAGSAYPTTPGNFTCG